MRLDVGFQDRLRAMPVHAILATTYACNARCAHCSIAAGSCYPAAGELDTRTWLDILQQVAAVGVLFVGLSGGEALLRPDILTLIKTSEQLGMRDRMNRVKRREAWRPLAPSVLKEHASRYFAIDDSPFMLIIPKATTSGFESVPAVVHVDGTARLQTVDYHNGLFQRLLQRFHELTGIPVVINIQPLG